MYVYDEDVPLTLMEQQKIQMICKEYDICYELVLAIAERESGFKKDAQNGNCLGMFQLNKNFHDVDDFFNPVENAEGCIKYLSKLFDKYEDDDLVLMIYHGESDAKEKYEKGEMSKYARGILERSAEFERKHGK